MSNLYFGQYPEGHPCDSCIGYIGVKNMSDKTKKLSLRNSYVREENEDL